MRGGMSLTYVVLPTRASYRNRFETDPVGTPRTMGLLEARFHRTKLRTYPNAAFCQYAKVHEFLIFRLSTTPLSFHVAFVAVYLVHERNLEHLDTNWTAMYAVDVVVGKILATCSRPRTPENDARPVLV